LVLAFPFEAPTASPDLAGEKIGDVLFRNRHGFAVLVCKFVAKYSDATWLTDEDLRTVPFVNDVHLPS
jgi:hypothetical protein